MSNLRLELSSLPALSDVERESLRRGVGADPDFSEIPELDASWFAAATLAFPASQASQIVILEPELAGELPTGDVSKTVNAIVRAWLNERRVA